MEQVTFKSGHVCIEEVKSEFLKILFYAEFFKNLIFENAVKICSNCLQYSMKDWNIL
jgi:hypothetical protein